MFIFLVYSGKESSFGGEKLKIGDRGAKKVSNTLEKNQEVRLKQDLDWVCMGILFKNNVKF